MKLTYKVLWIDDRQNQVSAAQEHIKIKLARMGFELELKQMQKVDSDSCLRKTLVRDDFDLLVVDYKMQPDAMNGSDIIKIIRRHCTSVDIVFYSSETPQELRNKINSDGVYCVSRNNLPANLSTLIESRLKKTLDLNQMRGLYLAAVADFDHLIDDIIHSSFKKINDEALKSKYLASVIEVARSYHQKSISKIESVKACADIEKHTGLLSSDPKISLLIDILSDFDDEQLYAYLGILDGYKKDIIEPRNKLAHSMEISFSEGKYTLKNNLKQYEFSLDDFLGLRHKVLDYKDVFLKISNI